MQGLNFRFEMCGKPAKLYMVEDNGDRDKKITQCYSQLATPMEEKLWNALVATQAELITVAGERDRLLEQLTEPGGRGGASGSNGDPDQRIDGPGGGAGGSSHNELVPV